MYGPHDTPGFEEFHDQLKKCTSYAICGRPYVRVEKLKAWLRENDRAWKLLVAVFRRKGQPNPPFTSDFVNGPCLLVFSILLKISREDLIAEFYRKEIVDPKLPISLHDLQYKLQEMGEADAAGLASRFDELQWQFLPAKFAYSRGHDFSKRMIVPISKIRRINEGGQATLWMIEILEEFVEKDLREKVNTSRYIDERDEMGYRYQFALKTFKEGNVEWYQNEINAFNSLRDHEGIVRYLDDYGYEELLPRRDRHGPDTRVEQESGQKYGRTYNILLEYGEFDLDGVFATWLQPVLQREIENFWEALFEVANALEGIHHLKASTGEYRGWHADVKPPNILNVQGKFKLSDPGFAKFVKKTEDVAEEVIHGGTETYGAPEQHSGWNGNKVAVSQTIDIWSLGCVFSKAATWVAFGYQGTLQFDRMRERAIERKIEEWRAAPHSPGEAGFPLRKGDYFHNGREVLEDVRNWHDTVVRPSLRKTDFVTSQVLDLVDRNMLVGHQRRIQAKALCEELREIMANAQRAYRSQIPQNIMKTLLEVDQEAPAKTSVQRGQHDDVEIFAVAQPTKVEKTTALPLMKTSHRLQYLKSELHMNRHASNNQTVKGIPDADRDGGPSAIGRSGEISPSGTAATGIGIGDGDRWHLHEHVPAMTLSPQRPKRFRKHESQNVFQAREAIEQHSNTGRRGVSFRRFHNPPQKDKLLSRYFGNRDIKFLVDNGESMREHWYEAGYLLETLAMKAVGQDENGMDLSFTNGSEKLDDDKKTGHFRAKMDSKDAKPMDGVHTDMKKALGSILSEYLEVVQNRRRRGQKIQYLVLIVLTDGIWEALSDSKKAIGDKIIDFVKNLEREIGTLEERPVSIEFIQFGQDEDATRRLRYLDDDLKGIPDIIDTEPSSGDVYKMLLGSFNEDRDNDESEISSYHSTAGPDQGGTVSTEQILGSPVRRHHRTSTIPSVISQQ